MDHQGNDMLMAWWSRSTGGSAVAVKPGDELRAMPQGPKAPGVDSVLDFVGAGLEGDARHLGFLVGGPGGGKSHAVSEFVSGMTRVGPPDDGRAHRSYTYRTPAGALLHLVNDATIPPDDGAPPTLAEEIDQALGEGRSVLVCVNRGVVIEEARKGVDGLGPGICALRWLTERPDEAEIEYVRVSVCADVLVQAAFLDTCSLLEEQPSVTGFGKSLNAAPYKVSHLTSRWGDNPPSTPAADLLARALEASAGCWEPWGEADPVSANFAALGDAELRSRVITILRSAEIFHGTRLTYRELWGILARALFGGLPSVHSVHEARAWVGRRVQLLEGDPSATATSGIRWVAAMELARVRTHSTLFYETLGEVDPVLAFVQQVDPVRDARPGELRPGENDPTATGWAQPIQEAFSAHLESGEDEPQGAQAGPLDLVLRYCPCGSGGTCPLLSRYVTSFDRMVDRAYVALRRDQNTKTPEVLAATREYARWLTRLYATAHGIPAFAQEVREWLRVRVQAQVRGRLEDGLLALLRPAASRREESFLPLMASRMVPITDPLEPVLAVPVPYLKLDVRCSGDDIELVVRPDRGGMSFPMPLDFSLVREATAASGGQSGVTERSLVTSARVERLRASLVRRPREIVALGPAPSEPIHVGGTS